MIVVLFIKGFRCHIQKENQGYFHLQLRKILFLLLLSHVVFVPIRFSIQTLDDGHDQQNEYLIHQGHIDDVRRQRRGQSSSNLPMLSIFTKRSETNLVSALDSIDSDEQRNQNPDVTTISTDQIRRARSMINQTKCVPS